VAVADARADGKQRRLLGPRRLRNHRALAQLRHQRPARRAAGEMALHLVAHGAAQPPFDELDERVVADAGHPRTALITAYRTVGVTLRRSSFAGSAPTRRTS